MKKFILWICGFILGFIFNMVILATNHLTPFDMRKTLCDEAQWKLPTCVATLQKAVADEKGDYRYGQ